MARTAELARACAVTCWLVACKQVDPPTRPTGLEPTPFDDILPGFDDPGTYAIPTHTQWTLDHPVHSLQAIVAHDFDGDGTTELVVGAPGPGGWEDAGTTSAVYWPEDAEEGGALEEHRQIVWEGVERHVGTRLTRLADTLVVESTPWASAIPVVDRRTFVFEDGWRDGFDQASYTLEAGGAVQVDWNADGVADLLGDTDAVAGPVGPGAIASWTWEPGLRRSQVHDGPGFVGIVESDLAFVPKPLPPGHVATFAHWRWDGPTIAELGPYVRALEGWLAARPGTPRLHVIHPERGVLTQRFESMHADVRFTPRAVTGDFDGDGELELAVPSGEGNDQRVVFLSVFRTPIAEAASEQDAWVRLHLPAEALAILDLEVADVDADGRDDLLVAFALQRPGAARVVLIPADDLIDRVPPSE